MKNLSKKLLSQALIAGLLSASFSATAFASQIETVSNTENTAITDVVTNETTKTSASDSALNTADTAKANTVKTKTADDIITFKGLTRYDIRRDNVTGKEGATKKSLWRTRLEPTVNLGNGWKIKNRMDFEVNYKHKQGDSNTHFYNRMLYLQGPAFGGTISLGKIDYADFANMDIAYGMIYDDYIKGGRYNYTDKASNATYIVAVGNFDSPHNDSNNGAMKNYPLTDAMHYAGFQVEYPANDRWSAGFAYHNVRSGNLDDTQQIFELASEYKLDKNFKLGGVYAISTLDHSDYGLNSSDQEQAYTIQLNYKAAKRAVPNTFGIWAAYRNLGQLTTFVPTYTNSFVGQQGYEIGARYVFAKNFTGEVSYFNGNYIDNHDKNVNRWFGRFEYRF